MAIHKENLAPIVKASTTSITLAARYNYRHSVARSAGTETVNNFIRAVRIA